MRCKNCGTTIPPELIKPGRKFCIDPTCKKDRAKKWRKEYKARKERPPVGVSEDMGRALLEMLIGPSE